MKRRLSSLAGNWRWKVKLTMKSTVTKAGRTAGRSREAPGWVFAIVGRGIIAEESLNWWHQLPVTWFFSFLVSEEGTCALHRPAAAFSQKRRVWLITNNQFAYLSWIVEDTNVSTYCSFSVTCASGREVLREAFVSPLSEQWLCGAVPSLHEWRDSAWPFPSGLTGLNVCNTP